MNWARHGTFLTSQSLSLEGFEMSNTDSLVMIGFFTFLMVWGLMVSDLGQKATDLRNQEKIVRIK